MHKRFGKQYNIQTTVYNNNNNSVDNKIRNLCKNYVNVNVSICIAPPANAHNALGELVPCEQKYLPSTGA